MSAVLDRRVSIAIPASIVSDTPHLREKTSKIGLIGRAAAIFAVDEVIVYRDNWRTDQSREVNLVTLLLSYMEAPQYLRKRLFKLQPELSFAGVLPPLRTPHHPLNDKIANLKIGEYREGFALSQTQDGVMVDIGVEQPAIISGRKVPAGRRVTVKITGTGKHVRAELADKSDVTDYWGYSVTPEKQPFGMLLKSRKTDLIIATSKYGKSYSERADEISARWLKAKTILVAFGSPSHGLREIVHAEGLDLESIVDFVINTIPSQGTATVRTEEALIASLAVLRNAVSKA